jgi:hypothetical protein
MPLLIPSPERDLFRRVMRRYQLNFVIVGEMVEEDGEYGPEPSREATYAELQMWYRIIPPELVEQLNNVWRGMPTAEGLRIGTDLDATPEELHEALDVGPVVYLSAADAAALRKNPPKGIVWQLNQEALDHGWFATTPQTKIYCSREVPQGYFLRLDAPDPRLNWVASKNSKIKPEPTVYWDLRPEPLLTSR